MSSNNKVVPFDIKLELNTSSMFQTTRNIGVLFGIIRPEMDPKSKWYSPKNALFWMLLFIAHSQLWFHAFRMLVVTYRENGDVSRSVPLMAGFVFLIAFAYMSSMSLYTLSRYLKDLYKELDQHQLVYGPFKRGHQVRKWSRIISMGIIPLIIVVTVVIVFIMYYFRQQLQRVVYPFPIGDDLSNILTAVVFAFWGMVTLCHTFVIFNFTVGILWIFTTEFIAIRGTVEMAIMNLKMNNTVDTFESIRQKHTSLLFCFELFNSIFKHYLFGIYAAFVPIVCFILYGIIRAQMTTGELVCIVFCVCVITAGVSIFTILGSYLHLKAHEPLNYLTTVNSLDMPDKTAKSISLFISRLTGPPIGFTIYNMFTIDAKSGLSIFGTLVTYALVMLQFTGSGEVGVGAFPVTCPNSTIY